VSPDHTPDAHIIFHGLPRDMFRQEDIYRYAAPPLRQRSRRAPAPPSPSVTRDMRRGQPFRAFRPRQKRRRITQHTPRQYIQLPPSYLPRSASRSRHVPHVAVTHRFFFCRLFRARTPPATRVLSFAAHVALASLRQLRFRDMLSQALRSDKQAQFRQRGSMLLSSAAAALCR